MKLSLKEAISEALPMDDVPTSIKGSPPRANQGQGLHLDPLDAAFARIPSVWDKAAAIRELALKNLPANILKTLGEDFLQASKTKKPGM